MALYKISVESSSTTNGIKLEKGISVQVTTRTAYNPISTNSEKEVVDAFMRIYGIGIKRAVKLSSSYLEPEKITAND